MEEKFFFPLNNGFLGVLLFTIEIFESLSLPPCLSNRVGTFHKEVLLFANECIHVSSSNTNVSTVPIAQITQLTQQYI